MDKTATIEQAMNGYVISFINDAGDWEKCIKDTMNDVHEYLIGYFASHNEQAPEPFEGFIGIPHSMYPEDM